MDRLSPEQLRYLAEAFRSFEDTKSAFYDDFLVHRLVALRLLPKEFDRHRPETREEIRNLTKSYPPTFEQWLWWESWVAEHSGHYALSAMTVGQLADIGWLNKQFHAFYGPDFDYYGEHARSFEDGFEDHYADFLEAVADKRSGRN